jgi:Collagen triple helix repeat (20 copies)
MSANGQDHTYPPGTRSTASTASPASGFPPPIDGEPGEDGMPGAPGSVGTPGTTGAAGPQGVATYLESDVLDGEPGPPGVRGVDGAAGSTGLQGPTGPAVYLEAEPGDDGLPGMPGATGPQGPPGITGQTGPLGPAIFLSTESGEDGDRGPQGLNGLNGITGSQGPMGPAIFLDADLGEQGDIGPPGLPAVSNVVLYNFNTADVVATGVDTYLTGSSINIPASKLKAGAVFRWRFAVTKTAAGLATPIWVIRIGTAGTVADAAIITLTGVAQTAAVDTCWVDLIAVLRNIGAAGILTAILHGRPKAAGFTVNCLSATSAGFDTTVANLIVGVSVNPGLNGVWTHQMVTAQLANN